MMNEPLFTVQLFFKGVKEPLIVDGAGEIDIQLFVEQLNDNELSFVSLAQVHVSKKDLLWFHIDLMPEIEEENNHFNRLGGFN